jgi:hypothetical protein
MQKRYCDCGCEILVEYRFFQTNYRVLFRPRTGDRHLLTRCPACGRYLNIDELG